MHRSIHNSLFRKLFLLCLILALLGCASPLTRRATDAASSPSAGASITSAQQQSDAIDRPTSKPYTGDLSIFEDPKRDKQLQPNRIMDILAIREGSSVADVGAGSGWFTVRAARRVRNAGTVFAVDINRGYLDYIEKRAKREGLSNIRVILGKEDDPLLPDKGIDAVLLLKTYHEVSQPIRFLRKIRMAMRPSALLGIIGRNGKGDDHGLDKEVVINEAERAGFVLVNQYDFVKPDNVDYFLVFRLSSSV